MIAVLVIAVVLVSFGFYQVAFGGSRHLIEHTKLSGSNGETRHSG